MFHPSRGGVRGGKDQFSWDDVKSDRDRENYLGHSLKAPVGRWQKGKDILWYTREKGETPMTAAVALSSAEDQRRAEIQRVKDEEEQLMREALGLAPKRAQRPTGNIDKQDAEQLFKREKKEEEIRDGERVQGLGFAPSVHVEGAQQGERPAGTLEGDATPAPAHLAPVNTPRQEDDQSPEAQRAHADAKLPPPPAGAPSAAALKEQRREERGRKKEERRAARKARKEERKKRKEERKRRREQEIESNSDTEDSRDRKKRKRRARGSESSESDVSERGNKRGQGKREQDALDRVLPDSPPRSRRGEQNGGDEHKVSIPGRMSSRRIEERRDDGRHKAARPSARADRLYDRDRYQNEKRARSLERERHRAGNKVRR